MSSSPDPQGATRHYFAWSTILDPGEWAAWLARHGYPSFRLPSGTVAEAPGLDLVYSHFSPRWGGRVAALTWRPGATVFGLLAEIPPRDWPMIQHAEGARSGKAVELELEVRVEGRAMRAITFSPRPDLATFRGPVSRRYAEALARGAERAGLPPAYVTRLEAEALLLERLESFGRQMGVE